MLLISSIVYWGFIIAGIVIALLYYKRDKSKDNHKYSEETSPKEMIYWILCLLLDALGGYIFFALCCLLIAIFIKFLLLKIILTVSIWYISLQIAHRVMPYIVNKPMAKIMGIDDEIQ